MFMSCTNFVNEYKNTPNDQKILLDVRSVEEVQGGALAQCINIPLHILSAKLLELDKNKKIFIYCYSGGRAQMASEILKKAGFNNVLCANNGGYDELKRLLK